jgi:DNA-directed RNA polymerase
MWKQSELYDQLKEAHEQLKIHDKMQKEFIDIAAHEQPIISLSEVVLYNTKDLEHAKLLEVINRNAKRLRRLTEDILDVTYIFLKKEQFNLNDVITDAIDDIITNKISRKTESDNNNNNAIKLLYEPQVLSYKLQSEAHK